MIEALKSFLQVKGYENITLDMIPDLSVQPEAIAIFQWDHTVGSVNDSTGIRYLQIQVRRRSYAEAKTVCSELFQLLDSGVDETLINLTTDVFTIARPRRGPVKLESNGNYTTFYFELALWGQN